MIEVLYDATHNDISVWTYSSAQGWVRHGDYIPVTFNDGDQFGVRGVSSWEYYAGGGRIGIWFVDVTGALLDDFGGGTLSGGEGLMAQGGSFIEDDSSDLLEKLQTNPKPTRTPSPTGTPTATQTPTQPPPSFGLLRDPQIQLEFVGFGGGQGDVLSLSKYGGAIFAPVSLKLPAPVSAPQQQSGSITIDYVYDPLYRLKEANYSNGDQYHYTYDAVGNRLTQETLIGSVPLTTNYAYDAANRLTSVDGVTYTWDNNGNLLNDGANSYTYNTANQLTAMSGPFGSSTFSYNGLGDWLHAPTHS